MKSIRKRYSEMNGTSYFCIVLIVILGSPIYAQSIFEAALSGVSAENRPEREDHYELSGYMRGAFYAGKRPGKAEVECKSAYAEESLRLRVRKEEFGDGFAEIRFRRGNEFNQQISELNLREAYVNTHIGPFDFRTGHQIVVWGRADGLNPTDNVTPKNMTVRSTDEDDRREGNFLVRSFFNRHPFRLETIWVPVYSPSIIPIEHVSFPPGISLATPDYPDGNLKNSAAAIRLNFEGASFDGSLSCFDGYNPSPGIDTTEPAFTSAGVEVGIIPTAYRMRVVGADFSTTTGSTGIRGEFAYRIPHEDHDKYAFVPNPDLQIVIGADGEFGNLNVILQYVGRHVFDFAELPRPQAEEEILDYEIGLKNRIFSGQLKRTSHAISFRPAWSLMYEALNVELLGLYNLTTEELYLKPKITYDIADALSLAVGGELFQGPDNTLYGLLESRFSAVFVEFITSF